MRRSSLAIAFVLLVGCTKGQPSLVAPSFELKDLSGNRVSLQQFRGHPVFLDFWATWCPPCLLSTPYVEAFTTRHKKDGLVTLGINVDEDPAQVYAYVKKAKISYPTLFAGESTISSDYGLEGYPSFILIDAAGKVAQVFEGFGPEMPDGWESEFQRLLAKSH